MTGRYPWRQEGTGILTGDAALIIPANKTTLPLVFQKAGYQTGIVGKWHLGLGAVVQKNWNATIKPGPNEVGFNFSFIFPATADRVPTVFIENGNVVGLDLKDPIKVSYKEKIGGDPTGKDHPELLKMHTDPIQGHDQTIVNNIGRIGYMTGGKTARWTDEELTFTFLDKATIEDLIEKHRQEPHLRLLQKKLAEEITVFVHSQEEYEKAVKASNILFGNSTSEDLKQLDSQTFLDVFDGITQAEISKLELENGIGIIDALSAKSGFLPSNSEARRALKENSISVNREKVSEEFSLSTNDLINNEFILLQRGKKTYFILRAV